MKTAKTHFENSILPAATVHFSRNVSYKNTFDRIFTKNHRNRRCEIVRYFIDGNRHPRWQKSQNGGNELNFIKFSTFSPLCGRQVLAAGISPLAGVRMAHFSTVCTFGHFLALLELSDLQKEPTYLGFGGDRLSPGFFTKKGTFPQKVHFWVQIVSLGAPA